MYSDILETHLVHIDRLFAGSLYLFVPELRLDPPSDIDSFPRIKPVDGPLTETILRRFEGVVLYIVNLVGAKP